MKIYLTGPLESGKAYSFQQMQEALNQISGPFQKNSPLDFGDETCNSLKSHLQARLHNMLSCDMVVTMDHIDIDPLSKIEVTVARQAEMKVVPFWKFMKDARQE
jgi:hypothetical protein